MFGVKVPDVEIPAVPEIPKIPEVPSLPKAPEGGDGGDDINTAIKLVDELSGKLEAAESKIYGMLKSAIPTVSIKLPQMNPDLFSSKTANDTGGGYQQAPLESALLGGEPAAPGLPGNSPAKKKAAEVQAKAKAAAQKAEDARLEMEEQAKQAMAQQAGIAKQLAGQAMAGVVSIVAAVGVAYAQLGDLAGPMVAGMVAAAINVMGFAVMWKGRAGGIFDVVNGVFDKMKGKVVDVLDTVDEMIMGPLSSLENAIDDMCEEQAPVLEKMTKFETGIKQIDSTFNLPSPDELKKPLDGCEAMIDKFVGKAKEEVPAKLEEMIQATLPGRIATDASTYNRYVVMLPIAVVLIVNMSMAALQVYVTASLAVHPQTPPAHTETEHPAVTRHLRGTDSMTGIEKMIPKGLIPKGVDSEDLGPMLMPYAQPALVQILLACLQAAFALVLSQGPRICKMLNSAVLKLQEKLNERVNGRIKEAVDRVFGQAFGEVKTQSDSFFPKLKDSTKKLKQAMEMAAKAQAAAGAAGAMAKGLGF